MTTPNPLTQQRQFVRDFVAASKQRSERERTAQQQYATGEKAAQEQHAGSERAAQQSYAVAIKAQEDMQRAQRSKIDQAVATIDAAWHSASEHLRLLGTPAADLPPALKHAGPRQPTSQSGDPLAAFTAGAGRIRQLGISAGQLTDAKNKQRERQRKLLIGAAVVAVILGVAGYFLFQRWSYDQRVSGLYQAGVAALDSQDWQVARDRLNELLTLEPGYQDAQSLLYNSYILPGQAAFEAGDWQAAQAQLGELLKLVPDYRDAQTLLYESYYRAGKTAVETGDWQTAQTQLSELLGMAPDHQEAQTLLYDSYYRAGQAAFEAGDWQTGLFQLGELVRMQPDNADARNLLNQYAQDIGAVTNSRDNAIYVPVPAGKFLMGSPNGVGDGDERPQHTVYLDAFWIMQTEVTNAQYAKCVAASACSPPDNSRWQDAAYADHPVTNVDWNQANAYAQWAGGRLPTEAEWEKTARGPAASSGADRTYPWGDEQPDQSLVNCCNFVGDTTPVGSYRTGVSPYIVLDMAGNVWEWTADLYDSGYYSQSPAQNPAGPAGGEYRVFRGGAYYNDAEVVRVANRTGRNPDNRNWNLGFRVASSSPGF